MYENKIFTHFYLCLTSPYPQLIYIFMSICLPVCLYLYTYTLKVDFQLDSQVSKLLLTLHERLADFLSLTAAGPQPPVFRFTKKDPQAFAVASHSLGHFPSIQIPSFLLVS